MTVTASALDQGTAPETTAPAVPAQRSVEKPRSRGHVHGRTCYWDFVECAWKCG